MTRSPQLTEQYASQNRESAVIILADVARYGGEETALVIWARAVLEPKDNENGPCSGVQTGTGLNVVWRMRGLSNSTKELPEQEHAYRLLQADHPQILRQFQRGDSESECKGTARRGTGSAVTI